MTLVLRATGPSCVRGRAREVEVLEYSRHDAPEDFGSDHLPVVARVVVNPVIQ